MKKTLLIVAVLFAYVSSSFAQTSAHSISWTSSSGWMTVDGESWNNNYESKNIQLNINSNLSALELYGYITRGSWSDGYVGVTCWTTNSYYHDFYQGSSDPNNQYTSIRELFQGSPEYFGTLYIDMVAYGDAEGRLVVNWLAI